MHGRRAVLGLFALGTALVVALVGARPARAEEIKGRWRFDIQLGDIAPGGRISSSAGNVQTLTLGPDQSPANVLDPRTLGVTTQSYGKGRIELHAAYGLFAGKGFEGLLDIGIGYYEQSIDGIELSYAFDLSNPFYYSSGVPRPGCETLLARGFNGTELDGCAWWDAHSQVSLYSGSQRNPTRVGGALSSLYWTVEPISGGKLKGVPVTMDLLFRYRPTKRFNPYLGGGAGYLFVKLDESARWKEISDQLEGSLVSDVIAPLNRADLAARALAEFNAVGVDTNGDGINDRVQVLELGHRMQRPEITTPNTFFVEARGGFELQFAPRWAFFVESKFFWARRGIEITADGKEKWGKPTPSDTVPQYLANPNEQASINPDAFPDGGLPAYVINGGLRQPAFNPALPGSGPILDENGVPLGINGQSGQYYLNGGKLKYGGWVFTVGVRYTL